MFAHPGSHRRVSRKRVTGWQSLEPLETRAIQRKTAARERPGEEERLAMTHTTCYQTQPVVELGEKRLSAAQTSGFPSRKHRKP